MRTVENQKPSTIIQNKLYESVGASISSSSIYLPLAPRSIHIYNARNSNVFIDKCVLYCTIVKFLDSCYSIYLRASLCVNVLSFHALAFSTCCCRCCWTLFAIIWIQIQWNRYFDRLLNEAIFVSFHLFFASSFTIVCSVIRLNVNFQSYIILLGRIFWAVCVCVCTQFC